jgi:hypothetical protein
VDETYRLPLRKIVISTWLADVMAERFASPAAVVVTPVDPALFHPVPEARDGRLSTLMLHHEYPWKGVAEGIEVARRVKAQNPGLRLIGFGVNLALGEPAPCQAAGRPLAVRRVRRRPASGTAGLAL